QTLRQEQRQQEARGEPLTTDMSGQHDLLNLHVVVKSSEDVDRLRDSLEWQIGTPENRTSRIEESVRTEPIKGKIVRETLTFAYDNPIKQDGKSQVHIQLRIMTQDYRDNPDWQRAAKRD